MKTCQNKVCPCKQYSDRKDYYWTGLILSMCRYDRPAVHCTCRWPMTMTLNICCTFCTVYLVFLIQNEKLCFKMTFIYRTTILIPCAPCSLLCFIICTLLYMFIFLLCECPTEPRCPDPITTSSDPCKVYQEIRKKRAPYLRMKNVFKCKLP